MNDFDGTGEQPSVAGVEDARPPAFSDEALALRFAERYQSKLRYVAGWGKWLVWDGSRWRPDDTLFAFNLARVVCREASNHCNQKRVASIIASARTVAAVEKLAKSDRRLAATVDQWDANPWFLNTPAGTIDLKANKIRQHTITDYITKVTAVSPKNDCPMWDKFLQKVTNGNSELQLFLQRLFGYAVTGITSEHALAFFYGTGANGKSVLISTIAGIIGDYHRAAPIETFTASSVDRHPTDLAGLRGTRLVTAVETEEGRHWAESRIKTLTGGDVVSARFMRQDFFEFLPQFKLVITGNHKPGLRSVDEAIRRRFHLIPFSVTIPTEERDQMLAERLKREWGGILGWMVDGCRQWQMRGLSPPEIVVLATAAYMESEDGIGTWIEESCERDSAAWQSSTDLYLSWKAFADQAGEYAGTLKQFVSKLENRGFIPKRKNAGRGFWGLRIRCKPNSWENAA
jgi:putative DNA primase/helicase